MDSRCVLSVTVERKQSIWYYQEGGDRPFLRIAVALPALVTPLRTVIEKGAVQIPLLGMRPWTTYESNVLFALRFMIDRDVVGCNWIKLPKGTFSLRSPERKVRPTNSEPTRGR